MENELSELDTSKTLYPNSARTRWVWTAILGAQNVAEPWNLVGGHNLSPSLRAILHFKELSPPCQNALQMTSRAQDEKHERGDFTLSKPT